jgi:hypothetical protein
VSRSRREIIRMKRKIVSSTPGCPVLAVDSGKDWAWALVVDDLLVGCGLKKLPDALGYTNPRLVVEKPHTGQQRATAKDRITLAIRAGEVAGRLAERFGLEPQYIEPATWGGSVGKAIKNARVLERLSPSERVLAGKNHNVLDAIGIALFCVGRY